MFDTAEEQLYGMRGMENGLNLERERERTVLIYEAVILIQKFEEYRGTGKDTKSVSRKIFLL